MSSPTPFAPTFDAIDIDAAPARAAIEHAMAMCAIEDDADAPGFYLLDDAGGRFIIDRDFGVISLRDETLLEHERGAVHSARIRVIEPSGTIYELDLRLRISGRVPQLVTSENEPTAQERHVPSQRWSTFANAGAQIGKAPLLVEPQRFGDVFTIDLPAIEGANFASTDTIFEPSPAGAVWSI